MCGGCLCCASGVAVFLFVCFQLSINPKPSQSTNSSPSPRLPMAMSSCSKMKFDRHKGADSEWLPLFNSKSVEWCCCVVLVWLEDTAMHAVAHKCSCIVGVFPCCTRMFAILNLKLCKTKKLGFASSPPASPSMLIVKRHTAHGLRSACCCTPCTPPPVPRNRLAQEPPPGSAVEFSHHFFLPRCWVFHGSAGCRTAIQVGTTTFHMCCYGSPHQRGPYQSVTGAHTP